MNPIQVVVDRLVIDQMKENHIDIRENRPDQSSPQVPPAQTTDLGQTVSRWQVCGQHGGSGFKFTAHIPSVPDRDLATLPQRRT